MKLEDDVSIGGILVDFFRQPTKLFLGVFRPKCGASTDPPVLFRNTKNSDDSEYTILRNMAQPTPIFHRNFKSQYPARPDACHRQA